MNRTAIGILIALVVIAGGWYLLKATPVQAPVVAEQTSATAETTTTTTTTSATTTSTTPSGVTVFYTNQGFSPKNVSVALNTTVTFVNQSSDEMWIASDPHPTHQGYDGTTKSQHCVAGYSGPLPFDQCTAGTSFSFKFTKAGTWGYHNHGSAADKGTIVVTAN